MCTQSGGDVDHLLLHCPIVMNLCAFDFVDFEVKCMSKSMHVLLQC
jgi:hypothetical protein